MVACRFMRRLMRRLLSWPVGLAGVLGLDVWTVWAFFQSPFQVIGDMELHPPFFALLACVAFPVTMVLGGGIVRERIAPMLPGRRFNSLANDIRKVRREVEHFPLSAGWLFDMVSTLRWNMERLKITTPLLEHQPDQKRDWVRWLVLMAPLAETGNIRAARKWKRGDPLPSVQTEQSNPSW